MQPIAEPCISDALWRVIKPLRWKRPPRPKGGNAFHDDSPCLGGIVRMLKTGCQWQAMSRGGGP